jgi:hypothetical protein
MSKNDLPSGWDEARVRRVLAHYEEQSEKDATVEDERGVAPSETVMSVPLDLVPKVRKLIAKRQG